MAVEACVDASAEPVEAEADIVVTIVDPETAVQDVCDALEAAEQDKPSHIVLDLETVLDRAQFGQLVLAVQQEYAVRLEAAWSARDCFGGPSFCPPEARSRVCTR